MGVTNNPMVKRDPLAEAIVRAWEVPVTSAIVVARAYEACSGLAEGQSSSDEIAGLVRRGPAEVMRLEPFIHAASVKKALGLATASDEDVALEWLRQFPTTSGSPTPAFDVDYYLAKNPDVARAPILPFAHFVVAGAREGRVPSKEFEDLYKLATRLQAPAPTNRLEIFRSLPVGFLKRASEKGFLGYVKNLVTPKTYSYLLDLEADPDPNDLLWHYLVKGQFAPRRVVGLISGPVYSDRLAAAGLPRPMPCMNPLLHWLMVGRPARIIPTHLFEEDFYLAKNPDLVRWKQWLFDHYIQHGILESRDASPYFESRWYAQSNPAAAAVGALNHYLRDGEAKGLRPAKSLWLDDLSPDLMEAKGSKLDAATILFEEKTRRLTSPIIAEAFERAAQIEPLVHRPYGPRRLNWLPFRHVSNIAVAPARHLAGMLGSETFENVVLVPHCRMAGSARVAGELVRALNALYPATRVLLVMTDASTFEYPEWFGDRYALVDLPSLVENEAAGAAAVVLLDMLRCVGPKRIFNVNSKAAWDLFMTHGRAINREHAIFSYLFTWDINEHGHKGGYPISYFEKCFDHQTGMLFDNDTLKIELSERYMLPADAQAKIKVLITPIDAAALPTKELGFEARREAGKPLRVMWAGRFDRQKRFDLVIDLAAAMPDIEVHAWGREVLDNPTWTKADLPPNIELRGTYRSLHEIDFNAFDLFLYTAAWDGLPTILLDIGAIGMPTIASMVGGIPELLDDSVAWPVVEVDDPGAYVREILAMMQRPAEVDKRAAALRTRVLARANSVVYRETLSDFLARSADDAG